MVIADLLRTFVAQCPKIVYGNFSQNDFGSTQPAGKADQ